MQGATAAERQQFESQGFFTRERVFSQQEIAELREAAEHVHSQVLEAADRDEGSAIDQVDVQKYQEVLGSTIKSESREDLRAIRSMEPTYHLDARLERLIDDPRVWEPCADLIGTRELSLFSDKLNVKRPGGAPFPWHQEGPYWAHGAEDLERVITLLVYLDDASEDNGCLWVIPGTHRHGALKTFDDRGTLGRLYTDVDRLDEKPYPVALPAGSVLWFHRDIVHGSKSNRSEDHRRAYLLAYQPAGLHQWRNGVQRDVATSAGA
ncbi:MAG: phytanoyl-CoA dioxygenase family protein [Deltaproteobacteria bacterium]|nr:phytanoyl-CoA dioxygenase family protein [Deltaproteobacteria bacterium]